MGLSDRAKPDSIAQRKSAAAWLIEQCLQLDGARALLRAASGPALLWRNHGLFWPLPLNLV